MDATTGIETSLCQNDLMPPPRKPRTERVEAAINAALAAHQAVQDYDRGRHQLLEAQAAAIRGALEEGATFAELGRRFRLHPSRIHQMANPIDPK
jgi:hypothetical protein